VAALGVLPKLRNQPALQKEMVMLSRFAKGRNPRLLPEWEFSDTTSQPSLSILVM
jgi:hypothetical protein